jgi:Fe-S cluster biogenesis protein NfuA
MADLKPAILGHSDHYLSNAHAAGENHVMTDSGEFLTSLTRPLWDHHELLETRVRPAVAQDGGHHVPWFQRRRGYLNMKGSCAGCPSSTATLKHGIENLLRHFVPEVTEVRPV